ncbi:hypothetical protein OVA13_11700 [Pseudoxanthomonas sp. SL93]|jgi:hypothetical protein|uniref:DUF6776 family protein n=1 Tax=Pseudoxanthomonas sp. SL93 TaxID=2995142 RepID=UPI0022707251|nr:DUF6776 family protein [Pseudoxanthomonas sp. SL93]WAC62067.1 hypothetical protein OVA13_11700 [Pseudoxanthomonas sp. SL93]
MPTYTPSRFQIVPRQSSRRVGLWCVLGVAWAVTVAAAWFWASRTAAPRLVQVDARLQQTEAALKQARSQLASLQQRESTLARSDQISRAANSEVQATLAERDEEIAGLRADVAFYERLVGATSPRKGLNVHVAEFEPESGGTWRYKITLTQNLNRAAISQGQMRFSVEGVRSGKLATVAWDELHQQRAAPGQGYSFRYFQQLDGNVMLPAGFTPQRVKVSLNGEDVAVEQAFDWKTATAAGGK